MAQQGEKYVTSLNPIGDVGFAVDKPVIDTSEGMKAKADLMTLAKATQLGATTYDQYADYTVKQDVGDRVIDEIESYKDQSPSWNSLPFVQQDKKENPDENDIKLNTTISDINSKIKPISNGVKQGKMTVFQSEMRIKGILQEAIKNNPGRADVITKYSRELLANAGLAKIYAADTALENSMAAASKQQIRDYENYVMDRVKKFGTPLIKFTDKTIDYVATEKGFQSNLIEFSLETANKTFNSNSTQPSIVIGNEMVKSGFDTKILTLASQDIRTQALALFPEGDDINPAEYSKRINTLSTMIDQKRLALLSADPKVGFGRVFDNAIIKSKFDLWDKSMTSLITRTRTWRNGEDVRKAFENEIITERSIEQSALFKNIGYSAFTTLESLQESYKAMGVNANDTAQGREIQAQIIRQTADIVEGISTLRFEREYPDLSLFFTKTSEGINPSLDIIDIQLDRYNNGDSKEKLALKKEMTDSISRIGLKWNNPLNKTLPDKASLTSFDGLIEKIFAPENLKPMKEISDTNKVTNDNVLRDSIKSVLDRTSIAIRNNLNVIAENTSDEELEKLYENSTTPGELSVSIKNINEIPEDLQDAARNYVATTNRVFSYINNQYKLYQWSAGNFNESKQESWESFMNEFYPTARAVN